MEIFSGVSSRWSALLEGQIIDRQTQLLSNIEWQKASGGIVWHFVNYSVYVLSTHKSY